jgi:hypothetical protein
MREGNSRIDPRVKLTEAGVKEVGRLDAAPAEAESHWGNPERLRRMPGSPSPRRSCSWPSGFTLSG